MIQIKSAEERLKERFWNGKYYEIHSGDFSEILDMMNEHAAQFIDLAAEKAETDFEFGNPYDAESIYYTVNKESILNIKEQIK